MASDLNAIVVAKRGRIKMLTAIFGGSQTSVPTVPPKGGDGKPLKYTPAMFDALFDKPREIRRK